MTLLKKLELVQAIRNDRQIHIGPTQLATTLLQTLRGVIIQKIDQQTGEDNKSFTERDKSGVMIPIQTIHDLLRNQAQFLDLLLLTTHINEKEYWNAISELLLLTEQYGLDLDIENMHNSM